MDAGTRRPRSFLASVTLPRRPLSPWLRLAHLARTGPAWGGDHGVLRTIGDCMLMLQLERDSWIWWEPLGGSIDLPAGSIAFIPPGPVHAWGQTVGLHLAVHFDLHARPELGSLGVVHLRGQEVSRRPVAGMPWFELHAGRGAPLALPLVTRLAEPERWRERLQPLVAMWSARTLDGVRERLRACAILAEALVSLAEESSAARPVASRPEEGAIAEVLTRIGAQPLTRRWSVAALARSVGMGETAFRAAFVRVTGATPARFLEQRRLERAARWLLDTSRPVARIAADAGYPDPYHFSRAFRRVFSLPPRAFRSRHHVGPG